MKSRRRMVITAKIILVSILLLACGNKTQSAESVKAEPEIKQNIVFIQQYTNYSDTYQNRGVFIDSKGNKIPFDLSEEDKKYADSKELLAYLEEFQYDPSDDSIGMKELRRYYDLLYKIDLDYKVKEESSGADQGRDVLYGVVYDKDHSSVMVLIEERGDWKVENTDPNAVKIREGLR